MKFSYNQSKIKLQGLSPTTQFGPPLSSCQLQALDRADSILYVV